MSAFKTEQEPIVEDEQEYERVITKNYWDKDRFVVHVLEVPIHPDKPKRTSWYEISKAELDGSS